MTWWVLTYYQDYLYPTSFRHIAGTNNPDHLFMKWSTTRPYRSRIMRTQRGKLTFCGYLYYWDTPNTTEQTESGDTYTHSFWLPDLPPLSTIWFYINAPYGPYDREIQGPLCHVTLPPTYDWPSNVLVATKDKGVFSTHSFTGPDGPQCTWVPRNAGLWDLSVRQLATDLYDPHSRHYCITDGPAGTILYRRQPALSNAWVTILADTTAIALTGASGGALRWVATNWNRPGYLYALFEGIHNVDPVWCLRSPDYGATWAAFNAATGVIHQNVGNILAGFAQGTSPHLAGDVIYFAWTGHVAGHQRISASFDNGDTWAIQDEQGFSLATPRCHVDPTDQSIVYLGAAMSGYWPRPLYRSEEHGLNLVQVDLGNSLAPLLDPFPAPIWGHLTNNAFIKILRGGHVWQTWDYCASWEDLGATQIPVVRMTIPHPTPGFYYLGREISGSQPPPGSNPHVLFISEDHGATMIGKSGRNPDLPDGAGDSIPFDCGGIAYDGILPIY